MRALLRGLIDDAAVFPPGSAALDVAIARHDDHRQAWFSDAIGPLLVPVGWVDELADLTSGRSTPLVVGLVARPGVAGAEVETAVSNALRCSTIRIVSLEIGWVRDWRDLELGELPLVLEIPRGPQHDLALADVRTGRLEGLDLRGKFRTGATPTWAWPDEAELADWLATAAALEVPVKLTGGLHHAIRGAYETADGTPEDQHGLLNVLLAAHAAADGAGLDHVRRILQIRDAPDLADLVRAWDGTATRRTRTLFTAFGCCEVTDPIGELTDLGLLTKD